MAVFVDHASIARVEVALLVDDFGRGVRALVVLLEHGHTLDQHLAVVGNLQFNARCRLADGVELDLAVLLNADIGTGFGLAVELFEVDADGAEELEQVRTDRSTSRIGHADARQAHDIAQRPVDQQVAQAVFEAVPGSYGLAIQNVRADALGQLHAAVVEPLLGLCGIFHADGHGGQHAFKHTRGRKVVGRADFAQVDADGVGRLGAVDGKARHHPLRQREQVVPTQAGGR